MPSVSQIKASVLYGPHDLRVEDREIDLPAADEVQVEVKATTLCGSDLHYYNHGANGDFKVREPLSLGHEASGIVTAVGSDVTTHKIGDHVALEVGIPCSQCKNCRQGKYHLCPKMQFRSSAKSFPHFQGTLQQRINHPAIWCHKVPKSIPLEQVALIEPLAVAAHATRRAAVFPGAKVLIYGAGAVGLLCAAMAKVSGATTIAIADIAEGRIEFAVKNGFATHKYLVPMTRGQTTEDKLRIAKEGAEAVNSLILDPTDEEPVPIGQYDIVFECTGVESCVQSGIYAAAPGGRLMLVGMGNPIQTLHVGAAATREVDILGVFRYSNAYPTVIALVHQGFVDLGKIITHRFDGLEAAEQAFKLAGRAQDDDGNLVVKTVITY
ncbi:chaperonin 10-like protein [Dipodascopsis uninucleata]